MHLLYSRAEQMSIEKYLIVESVQIYLYAGVCFYLLKIIILLLLQKCEFWYFLHYLREWQSSFLAFSFEENKQTFSKVSMKEIILLTPGSPLRSMLWIRKPNKATRTPLELQFHLFWSFHSVPSLFLWPVH